MTIEVRIRHQLATESIHFAEWPIDDLDSVFEFIKKWGLYVDGENGSENMSGQFSTEGSRSVFFEVVVGGEE